MNESKFRNSDVASKERIDFTNLRYRFHWTTLDRLPRILSNGLYSYMFAKKRGDTQYTQANGLHKNRTIYLSPDPELIYGEPEQAICLIVDYNKMPVPKIAPRLIVGVIIADRQPSYDDGAFSFLDDSDKASNYIQRKLNDLLRIYGSNDVPHPPIFGLSGRLYWNNE